MLIKSLFKSSFGQSNVVLRGRFATCRLINPAKSEIGRLSKHILENINTTVRQKNWT